MALHKVEVPHGRLDIGVPKPLFDGSYIHAMLEPLSGPVVPEPLPGTTPMIVTLKPPMQLDPTPGTVRIRGQVPQSPPGVRRTIFASGIPGTIYSDGTFEVQGLRPGVHAVVSLDDPQLFGALVAVGNRDVDGVILDPVSVLPENVRIRPPEPLRDFPPGAITKLAVIRGLVLDADSMLPVNGGVRIFSIGQYRDYPIDSDGRFEIAGVFPGTYTLDITSVDHFLLTETVAIDLDDKTLRFQIEPQQRLK